MTKHSLLLIERIFSPFLGRFGSSNVISAYFDHVDHQFRAMRQYGDVRVFKVNLDISLCQPEFQLGGPSTVT